MTRFGMVLILALLVAQSAAATPSFFGFTGLMHVPTADTLNHNEFNLAWFDVDVTGGDENVYVGNYGVMDGLEIGALRSKVEHAEGETMLNAKYRFEQETEHHPAIAVGVFDPTREVESTAYVTASKVVAGRARVFEGELTGLRATIGAGGGQLDGVFAGLSAVVGERLTLMAEYDTQDVNLGARLALVYGLRVHAAWLNDLNDFGVGVSYNKMF